MEDHFCYMGCCCIFQFVVSPQKYFIEGYLPQRIHEHLSILVPTLRTWFCNGFSKQFWVAAAAYIFIPNQYLRQNSATLPGLLSAAPAPPPCSACVKPPVEAHKRLIHKHSNDRKCTATWMISLSQDLLWPPMAELCKPIRISDTREEGETNCSIQPPIRNTTY